MPLACSCYLCTYNITLSFTTALSHYCEFAAGEDASPPHVFLSLSKTFGLGVSSTKSLIVWGDPNKGELAVPKVTSKQRGEGDTHGHMHKASSPRQA